MSQSPSEAPRLLPACRYTLALSQPIRCVTKHVSMTEDEPHYFTSPPTHPPSFLHAGTQTAAHIQRAILGSHLSPSTQETAVLPVKSAGHCYSKTGWALPYWISNGWIKLWGWCGYSGSCLGTVPPLPGQSTLRFHQGQLILGWQITGGFVLPTSSCVQLNWLIWSTLLGFNDSWFSIAKVWGLTGF